jgi:hypothetical protein
VDYLPVFAVFISLWAVLYQEFYKRRQSLTAMVRVHVPESLLHTALIAMSSYSIYLRANILGLGDVQLSQD